MKRAKVGDVYYIKVPNGYKIYQWAYSIPKKGDYIRVFDGLYSSVPDDIQRIVDSQHSYIISFYASRAYRIGLATLLGNYEVPEKYPFPKHQIYFSMNHRTRQVNRINVMNHIDFRDLCEWYDVSCMKDLPKEYQNETLLNSTVTPNWLLYLFDVGFDLQHLERFFLGPDPETQLKVYSDMVNEAMERYKNRKNQ